jgi:hypothetical protein
MYRIVLLGLILAPATEAVGKDADGATAFLKKHCLACHNERKQSGDVRLDDLPTDPGKAADRWQAVAVQIRDGLMPPPKEAKPDENQSRELLAWIANQAGVRPARLPNQGNLIPHEALFGKPAAAVEPPPGRVWRLNPDNYMGLVQSLNRGRVPGIVQPFTLIPERGIKDYAGLYSIDEPSTEILLRNAEAIVLAQCAHEIKDGKVLAKSDTVGEFVKLMHPDQKPERAKIESAIQLQHRMAIGRNASAEDLARYYALYEKCLANGSHPQALQTTLQAVLLKTDAVYRIEMAPGRTGMIPPAELARALSLALGERPDSKLAEAAAKGDLATKAQVEGHLRRVLADPKSETSRLWKFFRDYFEYDQAPFVFKDKPRGFDHVPTQYVADADRLVKQIVSEDKDVLRRLLTTDRYFVNYATGTNKQTRKEEPKPAIAPSTVRDDKTKVETPKKVTEYVYGVEKWLPDQPMAMPADTRLGLLMHPAWLVSWSTNFDNDPVRRGRWVRERLLGGTVPDLPIGVAAMVPNDPHRTYRDRLTVTREANCWKCHKQMDELGLPFENFDHYGRFRTTETVLDLEATEKNVDKKGKKLGEITKEVPLQTGGTIAASGDPKLDGPVKDPREYVRKLADSERVRQVFVRHVFRYFLGRNETLSDAATLQAADAAYVKSGGSFKELVFSLLTSDSFLNRSAAK